tara:strand:+ start:120 stop:476 length:357 start_codon:yes stop_codon:yes gene_type:complete
MNITLLMVVLVIALLFSIALNIGLVWYSFSAIRQIRFYDDELKEMMSIIDSFCTHLKNVYQMDMFYGDETLRHLLRHAQGITEVFQDYSLYFDEYVFEEDDFDNDDSKTQKEKENSQK